MKRIKQTLTFVVVASVLTIFSCTKEGENGADGTNGADGNANVKSVTLIANSTSNWGWNSTYAFRNASFTNISSLTYNAVNSGAVMLYQMDAGVATQLPVTITYSGKTESDFYSYAEGTVGISVQNSDGSDPLNQIPIPTTYKLVIIPQSAIDANPSLDLNNYFEVKGAFDLED